MPFKYLCNIKALNYIENKFRPSRPKPGKMEETLEGG
jgi:hypothetical protein